MAQELQIPAGAAISPLPVILIQQNFGWRTSFYDLGGVGVVWAIAEELRFGPGIPTGISLAFFVKFFLIQPVYAGPLECISRPHLVIGVLGIRTLGNDRFLPIASGGSRSKLTRSYRAKTSAFAIRDFVALVGAQSWQAAGSADLILPPSRACSSPNRFFKCSFENQYASISRSTQPSLGMLSAGNA
jgi:hypothetical protein